MLLQSRLSMVGAKLPSSDGGDFPPMVALARPNAKATVIEIPTAAFSSRAAKDEFACRLATLIRVGECEAAALSITGYSLPMAVYAAKNLGDAELTSRLPEGTTPPAEHPDRVELLQVWALDAAGGDAWIAEILRTRVGPPSLGPWRDGTMSGGLLVDPLWEALRDIATGATA